MKKRALLEELVKRFPQQSEKELHALVLCGEVRVAGETVRDPRRPCPPGLDIRIVPRRRYVSRGGDKLEGALADFSVVCAGKTFLDCGASSGGFTDCLLAHGAALVHAVDVGHAQFDFKLRRDPRVRLLERTNVAALEPGELAPAPEAAVIDLSFRPLAGIAGRILDLTAGRWAIALVKPQFEWERPPESFDGIVREDENRRRILLACADRLAREGVTVAAATVSRIRGARGNVEYFFMLRRAGAEPAEGGRYPVIERLFGSGEAP